jgi:hypothetical protein
MTLPVRPRGPSIAEVANTEYTPMPQMTLPLRSRGPSAAEVASTGYSREEAIAASPTGEVIFAPSFELSVRIKPEYEATPSPTLYRAAARDASDRILRHRLTSRSPAVSLAAVARDALALLHEDPSRRSYDTVPSVPGPSNMARPRPTNRPSLYASASAENVTGKEYKSILKKERYDADRNRSKRG